MTGRFVRDEALNPTDSSSVRRSSTALNIWLAYELNRPRILEVKKGHLR